MSTRRFVRDGEEPADRTGLKRVVAGATVGTALEWYDFFIFGTAAALVFGDLFFDPASGSGTLIAFATFGVGSSSGRSAGCSSATSATASGGARR
jgi:hypothetical protein